MTLETLHLVLWLWAIFGLLIVWILTMVFPHWGDNWKGNLCITLGGPLVWIILIASLISKGANYPKGKNE